MIERELTEQEKELVLKKIGKGKSRLILSGVIMGIITFVCLFIPMKFLPSKVGVSRRGLDQSLTLVESIGWLPTLIVLAIIGGVLFVAILSHTKYFKLKKDILENVCLTLDVEVSSVRELLGDAEKEYDVYLKQNEGGIKKLNYLKSEFPGLHKGDKINVILTKNAHYILSTKGSI